MVYFYITFIILGASIIGISSANSSISKQSILEPMILVDSDFTTRIYQVEDELENIGDSKIAELIDEEGKTIKYFFITKDESGNEIIEVVKPTELSYDFYDSLDEDAYIEKWVHTSIYSYPEKKVPNEEKVEFIEYVFKINEDLITQIKM